MVSDTLQIIHQPDEQRFYVKTGNGVSELRYYQAAQAVDFYKTFVVPADRHKGVAYALARQAVAWARQQQFVIQASCWYVSKYLDRHPGSD